MVLGTKREIKKFIKELAGQQRSERLHVYLKHVKPDPHDPDIDDRQGGNFLD